MAGSFDREKRKRGLKAKGPAPTANGGALTKVAVANELIERLIRSDELVLSAQVLNEFVSVATRKGIPPLKLHEVTRIIERLSRSTVLPIDASLVQLAL